MQASGFFKGLFLVSGWGLAAWLLVAKPIAPLPLRPAPVPVPVKPSEPAGETPAVVIPEKVPESPMAEKPLARIFREWAAAPELSGALLGFCVLDEKGEPLYASPLAETALCPASALKTVTTAAALEQLGPDYHFETTLSITATIGEGGVLEGNLVLTGSGDPTLASEDFEGMATAVAAAGLKEIKGMVLVDASVFPPRPANDHWNWGDIGNAYGAGAFGINVDHNRMLIRFRPGLREGEPAKVEGSVPPVAGLQWVNHVTSGPAGSGDGVVIYSMPYGRTVTLHGTVPAGREEFPVSAAIPDPPALASELLKAALTNAGVKIRGGAVNQQGNFIPLHVHRSAALPEIIDHLHRVSDNLEAQCLFLTMGRLKQADPAAALKQYWERQGVVFIGLRLIDGSGLARATMIRPVDLAKVNYLARRGAQGERFRQSLKTYVGGNVRSKLGAMSGVRTEVGYLTMPDGRELTFALMGNGLDTSLDFWSLRERLLEGVREGG